MIRTPSTWPERAAVSMLATAVFSVALLAISFEETQLPQAGGASTLMRFGGRVEDGSTGRPIPGAIVNVVPIGGGTGAATTTDASGAFTLATNLSGRYRLAANATGYLAGGYGQLSPVSPSRELRLSPGASRDDLLIRLWKSARLSGRVTDEQSKPSPGLTVHLLSYPGAASLDRAPVLLSTVTNADGYYSFQNLLPGSYVVGAVYSYRMFRRITGTSQETPLADWVVQAIGQDGRPTRTSGSDEASMLRTTFYPGTPDIEQADDIALGASEERAAVDFAVVRAAGRRVSGYVSDSSGPLAEASVHLTRMGNTHVQTAVALEHEAATTDGAGHFVFLGVPPGDYELTVTFRQIIVKGPVYTTTERGLPVISGSSSAPPLSSENPLREARSRVSVRDSNVDGLNAFLQRAPAIRGEVRFVGERQRPNAGQLSVLLESLTDRRSRVRSYLDADGRFEFPSVLPSMYWLSTDPVSEWMIRSVELNGRQLVDQVVDLRYASDSVVQMTFTDRVSTITGTALDTSGAATRDTVIFIFPRDERAWVGAPRTARMLTLDCAENGSFTSPPLAPSDYSVVAIVNPSFEWDWREPTNLKRLQRQASQIRLRTGERVSATLRPLRLP